MNKAIIGIAGCLSVATAVVVTGSAIPLWALILVGMMVEVADKREGDE